MATSSGLPTGTVTFLFTDIEGSTALLQALGRRYDEVLSAHNRLMRESFTRFGGREIGTEGDSFFVVFAGARDAVNAAVTAQRSLAGYGFPDGVSMRVRMGIHTGEGHVVGDTYRGLDVHRAARIAAAAHGGQVLLSETTRALVQVRGADAFEFADLGEHRLKDLQRPEHLFQLVAEGLVRSFPPPRGLHGQSSNLPVPASSFVGRESELRELRQCLRHNRLVTLTGPGGTGKTRLALRAGSEMTEQFTDGVRIVWLASVTDPELVPSAVAQAVGLSRQGVTSLAETVERYLKDRRMLLVLDNFEQVVGAAPFVARLLAGTSRLKILVTSRAALRISAEQELPVPPLALPAQYGREDLKELEQTESIALFVQRARSVRPDFRLTASNAAAIREICRRLDGLPLALELAAARMRTLEPQDVARRLNHSLDLLTGGPRDLPVRQQTLRSAVAWSYELLDAEQQNLFRQIGVFAGGFTLEAVETVCCNNALDVLEILVEHSLVKTSVELDGTRYRLLQPVREFALERLEAGGGASEVRRRHAEYFLGLVERAEKRMQGPEQLEWLDRLEAENDNLRAALSWAVSEGRDDIAVRIAWGMWMFWWLHGYHQEGRRWMDSMLKMDLPDRSRTIALTVAGNLAVVAGDHTSAQAYLPWAVGLARKVEDKVRLAVALHVLGLSLLNSLDLEASVECLTEALPMFTASGNQMMVSGIRTHLGTAALMQGDLDRADSETLEGLAVARRSGDPVSTYFALYNLGQVAMARGDFRTALNTLREGLLLAAGTASKARVTHFLESIAIVVGVEEDAEKSARLLGASAAMRNAGDVTTFVYLSPSRSLYDRTVAAITARLGSEVYEELRYEGGQLTIEQAIAYALEGSTRQAQTEAVLAGV
jgi:predicted ATPase/class 3 adenylate cyclase